MAPPAPTRFATVWFPDWPVIAADRAGGAPVAVLAANRVVARSSGAAAEGGGAAGFSLQAASSINMEMAQNGKVFDFISNSAG